MDLPAEPQLRWILRHSAALLAQGAEPVRGLILPTMEFFPDRFDGSPAAIAALMSRVQEHAGLADLKVELAIVTPEGEAQTVNCSSGACGGSGKIEVKLDRVTSLGDGAYRVAMGVGEIKNPSVLTTAMVRSVAAMFMIEADAYAGVPLREREPLTDLAAVLLGFGVLTANGAHIVMKGCSGVSVHSATQMPVDEVTVALAVFCKLYGSSERAAARYLESSQREHFDEAVAWAGSNERVVRMLRDKPEVIEADGYSLSPARSWLARALGVGKKKNRSVDDELGDLEQSLAASASAKKVTFDAAKAEKLAELRALVDENLQG